MMASSPCDCWTHLTDSLSPSSSSSSLISQTSSSIEHVWSDDIKLPPLSNSPVDLDLNNHSCFLKQPQPPSTLPSLTSNSTSNSTSTSTSTSTSVFHKTTHHQDQKHMRILRNRESAVRSRARKQAYKSGLEVEIARLTEENSRLRTRLKELQCCLSSGNPPKLGAPCKASSSPF